jgi:alpha-glucosidase
MSEPTPVSIRSHAFDPERAALTADLGGPRLSLTALTRKILRVRLAPDGRFQPRRPWAVNRPDEDFTRVEAALHAGDEALLLDTGEVTAALDRATGRLTFLTPAGKVFCADEAFPTFAANGELRLSKLIDPKEHFYGFGERGGANLEKTGHSFANWATDPARPHGENLDPMYIAMPLYLALRPGLAYGLYLNNTYPSRFDLGGLTRLEISAAAGELDYYLIYGPTPAEVVAGFSEVLGRMPLPPRWALGYHQSRWSYGDEAAIRSLIENFRRRDLPCDAIHFDIDYMNGYRVFTWDPSRFPDPAALTRDLAAEGFRAVTIIDPGVKVDPDYRVYKEGLEKDAFVRAADGQPFEAYVWPDRSVWPDFSRPDVRRWWGDLQRELVDFGVSGVWNDMNEPAVFEKPFSEGGGQVGTLPLDAKQGPPGAPTNHLELHNLYGLGMAQASYEGLRRLLPDQRPFTLCRSGFAGIQRWTAAWMGDNQSWWSHLELSLPQLMNMGLSGVPFVGVDVGGFADNATPELFARWIQAGLLYPFYRGHTSAGTLPQEPWAFGSEVEAVARKYLKLRYRLLPYLYSLFWEAATTGAPVLRPLLYHFPDDEATYHLHDQAMLGPALLAAPVVQPGRRQRAVYLPAGEWYDYWTDKRLRGPLTLLADAPLDRLPLYVRVGSVLPLGPELRYTGEKPLDPLTLEVYPGQGEFSLYEDDGISFAFEDGAYALTRFRQELDPAGLTLYADRRVGRFEPPQRQVIVRVHGVAKRPPAADPQAAFDEERHLLTFSFTDTGRAQRIRIA